MSLRKLWGIVFLVAAAVGVAGLTGSARASFPGTNDEIVFEKVGPTPSTWAPPPSGALATYSFATGAVRDVESAGPTRSFPEWSPDSRRLVWFEGPSGTGGIRVRADDGTLNWAHTDSEWLGPASWTPDGRSLVFGCGVDLCRAQADGSDLEIIAHSDLSAGIDYEDAILSPDGTHVVMGGAGEFAIANVDGSGYHRVLTTLSGGLCGPNDWMAGGSPATWSPDGSKLAYCEDQQLVIINTDGTDRRVLATNDWGRPSWSPDGTQLVFSAGLLHHMDGLATVNVDGSGGENILMDDKGQYILGDWPDWRRTPTAAPEPPNPPSVSGRPAISGASVEGSTLTASAGTWNGDPPLTYAYQWQRCDTAGANCTPVDGATAGSYRLGASDVGRTMRVDVTAANAGGRLTSGSDATGVVAAANAAPRIVRAHTRWVGTTMRLTVAVCDDRADPVTITATDQQQKRTRTFKTDGAATCETIDGSWTAAGRRHVVTVRAVDAGGAASAPIRMTVARR